MSHGAADRYSVARSRNGVPTMRRLLLLLCLFACGCETVNVNLSVEIPLGGRQKPNRK